jgi:hypothetical protein
VRALTAHKRSVVDVAQRARASSVTAGRARTGFRRFDLAVARRRVRDQ